MVDTIKCDLCGAEARYYVTKEFDGRAMNFCCRGCLQVFEFTRQETLQQQAKAEADKKEPKAGSRAGG
jgi:Fe2+ or Zn2+ uptake regulation protein